VAERKAAKRAKPAKKAKASPKKAPKRATRKMPARKAAKKMPAKTATAPVTPVAATPTVTPPVTPALPAASDDAWIVVPQDDADPWLQRQPPIEEWAVVDPVANSPAPSPTPAPAPAVPPFDPATGEWLAARPAQPVAAPTPTGPPPESFRKGAGPIAWTVVLALDLGFLAFNAIYAIYAGLVLIASPESAAAQRFREAVMLDSPEALLFETLASFALFGLIPLLWVLLTRQEPREGTKRFLRLHEPGKGIARGVLLAIPLILAVGVLSAAYTYATEGPQGFDDPDENPAVQGILDNLSWPLAALVALCAGIGEEIFFRGLLQRWLGVWGQAILFGLAHSAGGYPPQILFACGLGVLFGVLVRRGWSLWTTITAHVLYDFTLLALGLAYKSSGAG
jgi:membrane protease YdiL (CAAX protease family)